MEAKLQRKETEKKQQKKAPTTKNSVGSIRLWLTVACVLAVMPEAQPPLSDINTYDADRENMDCRLRNSALTAAFWQFLISPPLVVVCFESYQSGTERAPSAATSIMLLA